VGSKAGYTTVNRTSATVTVTAPTAPEPSTSRLAGNNRFETAAAVAGEYAAPGGVVYIANGRNYPDALAAAPTAAFRNAPLLLTEQDSIPTSIIAELKRLQPSLIVVAGGPGVVSEKVFNQLRQYAVTVE